MAKIPKGVQGRPLAGLKLLGCGKVRNIHELPEQQLLVEASERISIFDFVLNAQVALKGQILTALNIFWRTKVFGELFGHDLVAFGADIFNYLPEGLHDQELAKRAVVINKRRIMPIECIARGYLTGSGWRDYQETGVVCGHRLPLGLHDGSELPFTLFTPSTKADVGHDVNIDADGVANRFGHRLERLTLQLYELARQFAMRRGIILADTKFEVDEDLLVCDEVLTPDSSRYWDFHEWLAAQQNKKPPRSLDKEFARQWGIKLGIKDRDPKIDADVEWVHQQEVPAEVLEQTTRLYRYIFWRLTGMKLEVFQDTEMGLDVASPDINVDVVLGSRSDLPAIEQGLQALKSSGVNHHVHIVSCHRNAEELRNYAMKLGGVGHQSIVDVVIAAGGKAFALPGVLKAWLNHFGKSQIPVIGVGLKGKAESDDLAAVLSIENLPGNPVELDQNGNAYFGSAGFKQACVAAFSDEFLPRQTTAKPAEFDIAV